MKILHTADWHIGKTLHKQSLEEDFKLFFNWLLKVIDREQVDLLLISGDIFDMANPSTKDRQLYYKFLHELLNYKIQIIITGGNHDSIGLLNAPKELLNALNISIFGGATDDIEDELIPIYNKNKELELIVAAVPFLRDKDLRNSATDQKYKNRTEAIREGIKKHYNDLSEICDQKYKNVPTIAMGHLYTVGALTSESERDIHVGNQAAVDASVFSKTFDYVALGHIHKPQIIGKNEYIRYSGSPIALSFSEKKDDKSMVLLNLQKNKLEQPVIIPIPKSRDLIKFKGSLEFVTTELSQYNSKRPLPSFVELEVIEPVYSEVIFMKMKAIESEYEEHESIRIIKPRIQFESGIKDTSDLFEVGTQIDDLSTKEVFEKKISIEELSEDKKDWLRKTFQELIETIEH